MGHAGRLRGDTGALVMVMESAPATFCRRWEGGGRRTRAATSRGFSRMRRVCTTQPTGREEEETDGREVRKGGKAQWPCRRQG